MTARTAWFCPACNKHHAPHVETCPGPVDAVGRTPMPLYPLTVPYSPEPHPDYLKRLNVTNPCDCKGACGNVACPNRPQIWSGIALTTARGAVQ